MIIDPDYARIYTKARILGWQYGWCVTLHGSMTRDLDLIMVPWEDRAHADTAAQVLRLLVDSEKELLRFRDGDDAYTAPLDFSDKPHGRKAISLLFRAFGDPRWIDVSVMPCIGKDGAIK